MTDLLGSPGVAYIDGGLGPPIRSDGDRNTASLLSSGGVVTIIGILVIELLVANGVAGFGFTARTEETLLSSRRSSTTGEVDL